MDWRITLKNYLHRSRATVRHGVLLLVLISQWSASGKASSQDLPPEVKAPAGLSLTPPPTVNNAIKHPTSEAPNYVDPLGRTSPYGSVLGFLRAAEAKDFDKANQYLDGTRSTEQSEELVSQLKYLLDRGMTTSIDDLSRSPNGNLEDQMRSSREYIGTVKTPKGELKLILTLVKRPGEASVWLFSQETLALVPDTYATVQHRDYGRFFPAWTTRIRFQSVPLWRWAVILLSLIAIFGTASLLTRAALWLPRSVFNKRLPTEVERSILALKLPIFCPMVAFMDRVAGGYAITALGRHYWEMAGFVLAAVSMAWLVIRVTETVIDLARQRLLLRMQVERITLVSLLGRLFKILAGIVLVVVLLTHAGVNVSALAAGLGIGGIALALAAQKTLGDLFGGFSIVMRGAIRVGDLCRIDGITGTVEDIGISALNLRTLDCSVVSIPNTKVAEQRLENISLRDRFWVHQLFTLKPDTPHTIVKVVSESVFRLLEANPEIDRLTARARVINLTSMGPQIEVSAYFQRAGADFEGFLEYQENLILKILAIIETSGTSLASPIGALGMGSDEGTPSLINSE